MIKTVICSKKKYQKKQFCFEEQQAINEDENIKTDDPMDVDTTNQRLYDKNNFDYVYAKSVILELSSSDISDNYGKLQSAFKTFEIF